MGIRYERGDFTDEEICRQVMNYIPRFGSLSSAEVAAVLARLQSERQAYFPSSPGCGFSNCNVSIPQVP
jgi:hypothetical protein